MSRKQGDCATGLSLCATSSTNWLGPNSFFELAHLIRRGDLPHLPQRLPRPPTAEQEELLQQEFLRHNDLGSNAFLLIRHTGMRIGEYADRSFDCLRPSSTSLASALARLGEVDREATNQLDKNSKPFPWRRLRENARFFPPFNCTEVAPKLGSIGPQFSERAPRTESWSCRRALFTRGACLTSSWQSRKQSDRSVADGLENRRLRTQ
jgi:hypothetical protein